MESKSLLLKIRSKAKEVYLACWPSVLIIATIFLTFFTTLVTRSRSFYVFPDNIDQFYAWYQRLAQSVHRGVLPLWDANVSGGHSFVGELQAGVFYPINIAWVYLFGSPLGIHIWWLELLVIIHFSIAALGMYVASRSLGLQKIGSIVAALAFALGGGVAVRSVSQTAIFFGLCYLPWVLYFFIRWHQERRIINLALCSVVLGFMILAGHIDPWYFACLSLLLFIIFHTRYNTKPRLWIQELIKPTISLIVVVIGSTVVALPQLLLSAQYLPQSVRFVNDSRPIGFGEKVSVVTFTKLYSFKPDGFLSLVDPVQYPVIDGNEIYVGLLGFIFLVGVLWRAPKLFCQHIAWRQHGRFIAGTLGICIVIMIGYWTFVPSILRELPLISQIRELARYAVLVQLCVAFMVGISVEVLCLLLPSVIANIKSESSQRRIWLIVCASLVINTVYLYIAATKYETVSRHFFYQSAIVCGVLISIVLLRKYFKFVLLIGFGLSAIVQPVWFMPKISGSEATYPPHYYERTPIISFLENYYGRARTLIEDDALPPNIGDVYAIQTVNGYGATLYSPFHRYLNEPDPENDLGYHMDLLNVQFLVSKKVHPELIKKFTDDIRGVSVYKRSRSLPRIYFADEIKPCRDQLPECTNINIIGYTDSSIVVEYNTARPRTLILSEINYTGWNAYIDGKRVSIQTKKLTGTPLFRAISVPDGQHTVKFLYEPFAIR